MINKPKNNNILHLLYLLAVVIMTFCLRAYILICCVAYAISDENKQKMITSDHVLPIIFAIYFSEQLNSEITDYLKNR